MPWGEPMDLVVFVLIALLYFLPFLIALFRDHPQVWPIFWLDVFLGWSGLGWIAAFIWSVAAFQKKVQQGGD